MAPRLATIALALMLPLSGCLGSDGGEDERPAELPAGTLTVYSSLPRHGASAPVADAVWAGQKLALEDAGTRRVRLVRLDATDPDDTLWDPHRVDENAERAADDDSAVAYLGELDLGASAISLPITSDAGLLQLSPTDGLTSLTTRLPAGSRAGPERYRPEDRRTFARLVPNDLVQADVMLERLRALNATRPALVFGEGVYGDELADQLVARGRRKGVRFVEAEVLHRRRDGTIELARKLAERQPDAVVIAADRGPGLAELLRDVDRAMPGVPVLASGAILPTEPLPAGSSLARLEAISPIRPPAEATRAGRRLLRRLGGRPEALHGYESMRLVLDAVADVRPLTRTAVVDSVLAPGPRRSPLGTYEVSPAGDVDRADLALYELVGTRFRYVRNVP